MDQTLDAFLTTIGATKGADQHSQLSSDNSTEIDSNFISPLTHYGLLAIDGPDTAKFLQGQTTCDLTQVTDQSSQNGACCTVKGRLYSSFLIGRLNDEQYRLRMRHDIVDDTQQRLAKYIVFSKAEQTNTSDDYLILGLKGDQAKQNIAAIFGDIPSSLHNSISKDKHLVTAIEGDRFECWLHKDDWEELWPALSNELTIIGSSYWELLAIRAGIADICTLTQETFIPQMLNYQVTNAVSFTKGCYTGQEIVARMQYKGKLKRRMYRIALNHCESPTPGDEIFNDSGSSIGNLVNIHQLKPQQYEALAVITNEQADHPSLTLAKNNAKLEVLSLPYAINTED